VESSLIPKNRYVPNCKNYFGNLYSSSRGDCEEVLQNVSNRINTADHVSLTRPFQVEEKAPGSDGLKLTFYKIFCRICGQDYFSGRSELVRRRCPA